ncbi:ArsR/SmtB family transcription factor [Kitasatospora purpeofusca]|uniref:ArsR/SmtB family transcription factor n=1 Tax=Kitasatospora purpeofusca TaxID=67352 RepID=UPI00369D864B
MSVPRNDPVRAGQRPGSRRAVTYRAVWSRGAPDGPDGPLVALLGTTRARTLRAAADPAGTAELARRTGTSPATASHHATVLRAAGLLITERTHILTPLGQALLEDRTPDHPRPPAPPPTHRDHPSRSAHARPG